MTSNFYLQTREENLVLHIDLHGAFDVAAAFELIRVIHEREACMDKIVIDTGHISEILGFGKSMLNAHLPGDSLRSKLHFTGTGAGEMLPDGCRLMKPHGHRCRGTCKRCACRKAKAETVDA